MKTIQRKRETRITKGVLVTGALVLMMLLGAVRAQAYVLLPYKFPGSHPRIPYHVSTSLQGYVPVDGTFEDAVTAIQNAANQWSTAGGSEYKFFYAGTTAVNQVADDGINAIIFSNTECPYGSGCKAATFTHQGNGTMRGFDIVLYARGGGNHAPIYWGAVGTIYSYETDLWSIGMHELGHALGLDHSNSPSVVMGTTCGTGCSRRSLYSDDKNAIKAHYSAYTNEGLSVSATQVAAGASFTLSLSYPRAANQPYAIFMSTSGMEGFPLRLLTLEDSRILGINGDFFPTENYPGIFVNFEGTLNASGLATATVNLPADENFFGSSNLYFSAVTLDGQYLNGYEDVGIGVAVAVVAGPEPTPTPEPTPDPTPSPTPTPTPTPGGKGKN